MPTYLDENQNIRSQAEDVIHRQRSDRNFLALFNVLVQPGRCLLQVSHNIAMGQHGALGYTSGSAGVLKKSQIVVGNIDLA